MFAGALTSNSPVDVDDNSTFDTKQMIDLLDILPPMEKKILLSMQRSSHKDANRIQNSFANTKSNDEKMKVYLKLLKEISVKLLEQQYLIYTKMFAAYDTEKCKLIVKNSDICKSNDSVSLTYGDIDFYSFNTLLQLAITSMKTNGNNTNRSDDKSIHSGMVLVDLGHGTGRGVVAAALLYGQQPYHQPQSSSDSSHSTINSIDGNDAVFRRIVGVEIIPELYDISKITANTEYIQKQIGEVIADNRDDTSSATSTNTTLCDIALSLGDFLSSSRDQGDYFDWTTADIVFANSTCFAYELLSQISVMAESMKTGSMFISLTNSLPSPCFRIIHEYTLPMSWGAATCYVHERLPTSPLPPTV